MEQSIHSDLCAVCADDWGRSDRVSFDCVWTRVLSFGCYRHSHSMVREYRGLVTLTLIDSSIILIIMILFVSSFGVFAMRYVVYRCAGHRELDMSVAVLSITYRQSLVWYILENI